MAGIDTKDPKVRIHPQPDMLQLRDNMKPLWAPWRMTYITSPKNENSCVFCDAQTQPDCPENLIVFRGESAFVILNRYPYTNGHLMVLPNAHTAALDSLPAETRAEIMELTSKATTVLTQIYQPEGFNVGINIGDAAGAGIAPHIHVHIVPRWSGDTNFMSAVGGTRVIPEDLEVTWHLVRDAWSES